jgi:hypothetical protein
LSSCEVTQLYNSTSSAIPAVQTFTLNPLSDTTRICGKSTTQDAGFGYASCSWQLYRPGDCYRLVSGSSGKLFVPRRTDMLRSIDNGLSWSNANWPLGTIRNGTSLQAGSLYNSVTNQLIQCALDYGYWVSNDDGGTFSQSGPTGFGTGGVELLQLNNGRVLASMGGFPRGVYKSNDLSNSSWSNKFDDVDPYDFVTFDDTLLFSATSSNIIKSTDQGESWESLFNGVFYDVEKIRDSLFWVSSSGDVFVSHIRNVGSSIAPRSNIGAGYVDVKYDPASNLLVASRSGEGIMYSSNNGFTWNSCLIPGATNYYDVTFYQGSVYVGTDVGLYKAFLSSDTYLRPPGGSTSNTATVAQAKTTTFSQQKSYSLEDFKRIFNSSEEFRIVDINGEIDEYAGALKYIPFSNNRFLFNIGCGKCGDIFEFEVFKKNNSNNTFELFYTKGSFYFGKRLDSNIKIGELKIISENELTGKIYSLFCVEKDYCCCSMFNQNGTFTLKKSNIKSIY